MRSAKAVAMLGARPAGSPEAVLQGGLLSGLHLLHLCAPGLPVTNSWLRMLIPTLGGSGQSPATMALIVLTVTRLESKANER